MPRVRKALENIDNAPAVPVTAAATAKRATKPTAKAATRKTATTKATRGRAARTPKNVPETEPAVAATVPPTKKAVPKKQGATSAPKVHFADDPTSEPVPAEVAEMNSNAVEKVPAAQVEQPEVSRMQEENESLRATIEELTSKLASVNVAAPHAAGSTTTSDSSSVKSSAPAAPGKSFAASTSASAAPFGVKLSDLPGELPTALPLPCAGAKPARPPTAYQAFQNAHRAAVKAELPGASFGDINKRLAELWREAKGDAATVAQYEAVVADARARYDAEMEEYRRRVEKADVEKAALARYADKLKMQKAMELYERHIKGEPLDVPPASAPSPAASSATTSTTATTDAAAAAAAAAAPVADVKKARNAYAFFTARRHRELAAEERDLPEGAARMSFAQKAAQISAEWAALGKSRRKADKAALAECQQQAEADGERFRAESAAAAAARDAAAAEAVRAHEALVRTAVAEYTAEQEQRTAGERLKRLEAAQREAEKAERRAEREQRRAERERRAGEPKRARSGYQLFFADRATEVSAQIRAGEAEGSLTAAVGALWKAAGEDVRKMYADRAEEDKQRYQREMAAFKEAQEEKAADEETA